MQTYDTCMTIIKNSPLKIGWCAWADLGLEQRIHSISVHASVEEMGWQKNAKTINEGGMNEQDANSLFNH